MSRPKKLVFTLAVCVFAALVLCGVFLLTGQDAATSVFRSALEDAFEGLDGWTFEADGLSGNPVFGYSASNLRVFFKGEMIATAERLSVRLSLLSYLRGEGVVSRVTVNSGTLSGEGLIHALIDTDFADALEGSSTSLPVLVFEPAFLSTPMGSVSLNFLRLTPKDDTVSFYGQGGFLGFPIELGVSFITGDQLFLTDAFFRGGDAVVSLSGSLFPDTRLEGYVDAFRLDFISELLNLPLTAKGTFDSTLLIERPFGKLLASGEATIENGDIWDLFMDGDFSWSADEEKAVLYPSEDATVFSSPVSGVFSLFFGKTPIAEIALALKDLKIDEWSRCFPWLSFATGELASLKLDLSGPFDGLGGPMALYADRAVLQGFDVEDMSCSLLMKDGSSLDINGAASWAGSKFTFSGKSLFEDDEESLTSLVLNSEGLNLKRVGEIYAPSLSLEGSGKAELALSVPETDPLSFTGKLTFDRASILHVPVERLNAAFSGLDDSISVDSFSLSPGGEGLVSGRGTIREVYTASPSMAIQGDAKGVKWNVLEGALQAPPLGGLFDASWTLSGPIDSPTATFSLSGGETPLMSALPLKGLKTQGRYENDSLRIISASASLFKGSLSAEGSLDILSRSISLKGRFDGLSAGDMATSALSIDNEVEGSIAGEFSLSEKLPSPTLGITFHSPRITVGGIDMESVRGSLVGTPVALKVADLSAKVLGANVGASGVIGLAKGGEVDLAVELGELDLHELAAVYFPSVRLGGQLFSKLAFSGKADGPITTSFEGKIPVLSAYGLIIENAFFSLAPEEDDAFSIVAGVKLGESAITFKGKAEFTEEGLRYSLENEDGIDLCKAIPAVASQTAGMFEGSAIFEISGTISDSPSFEGTASASSLRIQRMNMTDVSIPFTWRDGLLLVSEGTALFHGGKARFDGKIDPLTMRFEGTAQVKEMDLESASSRILEGSSGRVGGIGDLTIRGNGTGGMMGLVFGSGQFSARDGVVSGFESLKSVSASGEIPFSSVIASFNMDGRTIFLLPGSRMSAPPGNEVFRFFSASGSIGWNDTPLDLKCSGDINVRALNAFIGAMQGFLTIDGNPLTDPQFLQRFITGLIGGMTSRDFRETTFNLRGSWDAPEMTDLKIASENTPAVIPFSNAGRDNDNKIRITIEVPTGAGSDTTTSPEEQVKKQLIENILKTIITPGTPDD
ncbi:MAG: hypothetical protein QM446_02520 [Synergistota bacterium]|nr:hypothetical protein [Synergistota bacterium]